MKRAYRSLWILSVVAMLAVGALSRLLAAKPAPMIGGLVALAGVIATTSIALIARILSRLSQVTTGQTQEESRADS